MVDSRRCKKQKSLYKRNLRPVADPAFHIGSQFLDNLFRYPRVGLVILIFLAVQAGRERSVLSNVLECRREEDEVDCTSCVPVLDFLAGGAGCVGDSGSVSIRGSWAEFGGLIYWSSGK